MTPFLWGFFSASACWAIAAIFAYRSHRCRLQVALNLPAASPHAHVRERMQADKHVMRGPWR